MAEVKSISVSFASGRDVLNAYWGFLAHGGLVIRNSDLHEGDPIALDVTIGSSAKHYLLRGHVVRSAGEAVVEFHPGEPHDLLLSAAWAETDNVPARQHPRFGTDRAVVVEPVEEPVEGLARSEGRILNVSAGGVCVHLLRPHGTFQPGADVRLSCEGMSCRGRVRWSRASDVGIEFDSDRSDDDPDRFLRLFFSR